MFNLLSGGIPENLYASLEVVFFCLLAAGLAPIISKLVKNNIVHVFVVEIIIGILIGPYVFKFVNVDANHNTAEVVKLLGLVFLIFLSGLDIDFDVIEKDRKFKNVKIVKNSLLIFFGIIALSAILASVFIATGEVKDYWLILIVLSATFAGVVVPIVHHDNIHNTIIGQFINTIATLSEAFSLIALSIYMITKKVTSMHFEWLAGLLVVIAIIAAVYKKWGHIFIKDHSHDESSGTTHLSMRWSIILLVSLVMFANNFGGEYILGAFLCGAVIKFLKPSHEFEHQLQSIGFGLFTPFYFVIIGTEIDIQLFTKIEFIGLILLVMAFLVLSKLPVLLLFRWFKLKVAIPTIFLMSSTIVVSITAAEIGHHLHIMTEDFANALRIGSILLAIIAPIIFEIFFPFKDCNGPGGCKIYREDINPKVIESQS